MYDLMEYYLYVYTYLGKVLIMMHDVQQTLPVVPGGDHYDIIQASMFSSPHWDLFERHFLIDNMRLQRIDDEAEQAQQTAYDKMIRGIGLNEAVKALLIEQNVPDGVPSPTLKQFVLGAIPKENIFTLNTPHQDYPDRQDRMETGMILTRLLQTLTGLTQYLYIRYQLIQKRSRKRWIGCILP